MHEEDVVETSDAEEREQIQASLNVYWKHASPHKRIKVNIL
jgi:hypothetical protein